MGFHVHVGDNGSKSQHRRLLFWWEHKMGHVKLPSKTIPTIVLLGLHNTPLLIYGIYNRQPIHLLAFLVGRAFFSIFLSLICLALRMSVALLSSLLLPSPSLYLPMRFSRASATRFLRTW